MEYKFLEEMISMFRSELSYKYLQQYWLKSSELEAKWMKNINQVFTFNRIPNNIFKEDFLIIPMIMEGGLFYKASFEALNKCMKELNEKEFIIFEGIKENELKFKYPVNISWEEISLDEYFTQEYITLELFASFKNMYAIGSSGVWAKYYEGENPNCISIIGVKKDYAQLFYDNFKDLISIDERKEINKLLPEYINKIIWNL